MAENVIYSRSDDIATIRLNRPERLNALTLDMLPLIRDFAWQAVDEGARAIILTGEGRAFCSGAELADGGGFGTDLGQTVERDYNPAAEAIANLPIPVVCMVNGPAAGAGAALALSADIVIAGHSAYFLLAFANIGLVPDFGATWLVAKSVGRAKALEMALLGERLSAQDARDAGLIARAVPDEQLLSETQRVAAKLASMPTRTLGMIKTQVRAALETGLSQTLALEARHQTIAGFSADFEEGLMAFREKRPPAFVGR